MSINRRLTRGWLALLALGMLGAAGCRSLEAPAPPAVSMVGLRFTNINLFETDVVFTVRLENESTEPVILTGAVYTIVLNSWKVGTGLSDRRTEIPRLSSVTQEIPVHVSNLPLLLRALNMVGNDAIRYEVRTKLFVLGCWGSRPIHVDTKGDFRLDRAQQQLMLPMLPKL